MRDDLSILIQGPINDLSLNCIPEYSKFASNIIISTWNIDEEKISEIQKNYNRYCNIKIISEVQPDYENMIRSGTIVGIPANTTFYWQVLGVYNGVSNCDTKYIIRTRSDEYFINLQPLLDLVEKNNFKFTCGNIWFRKRNIANIHIGDHLYFSETKLLNDSVKMILDVYHKKYSDVGHIGETFYMFGAGAPNSPEQVMAKSIMINYKKIDIRTHSHRLNWGDVDLFKEVFDVIDINELKPIRWNWAHGGKNGESFDDSSVIKNINEY